MSLKDFFKSYSTIVSNKSLSDLTASFDVESYGALTESIDRYNNILLPNIDFTRPEEFVKYGLAEKYYEDAINKIWKTYPWDGSKKQKITWKKNTSQLEQYIFDKEYPKETGSITIGTTFGTASVLNNGYYSTPARTEYIKVYPGLRSGSLYSASNRTSAFSFNSETGFCVEFFMKPEQWSPDVVTASCQIIFDMGARDEDTTSSLAFVNPGAYRFYVGITGTTFRIYADDQDSGEQYVEKLNNVTQSAWNHYAINVHSGAVVDIYQNGNNIVKNGSLGITWPTLPVDLTFSGTIGAFSSIPNTEVYTSKGARLGWNKFSGSLDEFRFWRRTRTEREIKSNWFTTIDGGFDNDELLSPDMGFYFKFNEGTTATSSIDSVILDYSGRKNHGLWTGYISGARDGISPIENEIPDPVIYSTSYRVISLLEEKALTARDYDLNNNASLLNNLPSFMSDDDEEKHLKNLTQILASFFDTTWLQISSLARLTDTAYFISGSLNSDILRVALSSNGISADNLFNNIQFSEILNKKTDFFNLEEEIEKIKQVIYKNIYNNLVYIFKSKGTEKALKSVFRAFGVDDEVLKIKAYANSKYEIDGSKRYETVRRKNLLDLTANNDHPENVNGVVFNYFTASESGSVAYLWKDQSFFTGDNMARPISFETTIVFPYEFDQMSPNYVGTPISASLFGFYEMISDMETTSQVTQWETNGFYFNAFAVKKFKHSKDAKFVFDINSSISNPTIGSVHLETPWFDNVFDNSKWTFAVRTYRTGSDLGIPERQSTLKNNIFDLYAIQEMGGQIIHTYSHKISYPEGGNGFLPFYKKTGCYVGARRTNFTGTVLNQTNAKFTYARIWQGMITNEDVEVHAKDVHNFGIKNSYSDVNGQSRISFGENPDHYAGVLTNLFIPRFEACLLNWDFEKEYTADSNGKFLVYSVRDNSIYTQSSDSYNFLGAPNYTGLGYGFNSGSIAYEKSYVMERKNREIGNLIGINDVSIIENVDELERTNIKPIEFFYTVENSIYSVVSEEILNFFLTIDDFSNLIGEPYLRYRDRYRRLDLLRDIFFSKLQNSKIDVNKYISYYIWLDNAISSIIRSLFPASAIVDSDVRNVIESHVLERSKHVWFHSFLLKTKPERTIEGILDGKFKKKYTPPAT